MKIFLIDKLYRLPGSVAEAADMGLVGMSMMANQIELLPGLDGGWHNKRQQWHRKIEPAAVFGCFVACCYVLPVSLHGSSKPHAKTESGDSVSIRINLNLGSVTPKQQLHSSGQKPSVRLLHVYSKPLFGPRN